MDGGYSAQRRLARLLEIDDSPIRKKVAFASLEPYRVRKTPPKTEAEIFTSELAKEDLSSYGPVSKMVSKDFNPSQSMPP